MSPLSRFRSGLARPDIVEHLREGLIGEGVNIPGAEGNVPLIYADYVASGRALSQVETFIMNEVLPYYANSHTEASFCGSYMTQMRREARTIIAGLVNAGPDHKVIFAGAGATAGINKIVHTLGVTRSAQRGERPVIIMGPYEHHSNILPWRETGAEIVQIDEGMEGGPDLMHLERELIRVRDRAVRVGSFSATSNVTGICTDIVAVTSLLKKYGAYSIWDFAGGAPYVPIDMCPAPGIEIDAAVVSTHKFVGGPGATGVLIAHKSLFDAARPASPGGGTVTFASPWGHDYSKDVSVREEGGTPNVIGDVRAALAFLVKDAIGQDFIAARMAQLNELALSHWQDHPNMELLGVDKAHRIPIFSFRLKDGQGQSIHHQMFTRMLSDFYGIQARGGCACAGPYAHSLLGIDREHSDALRKSILSGYELDKPGWVRLNFSYLLDDAKAEKITTAVSELARRCQELAVHYEVDPSTARFLPKARPNNLARP